MGVLNIDSSCANAITDEEYRALQPYLFPAVTVGQVVESDVTGAITGNGTYSFGLENSSSTAVQYSSDEGATRPVLEVTMGSGAKATRENGDGDLENAGLNTTTIPEQFSISQSYPNPFNGQTTIVYSLPHAGHVRLIIYNTLGRAVRRVVDEQQEVGHKRAIWDGADDQGARVSSGVYFCQVEFERQKLTKKIIFQQ